MGRIHAAGGAEMSERVRSAEVSRMTSLSVRRVQELAIAGKVPSAAKISGSWTFDPVRIRIWIRQLEADACRKDHHANATSTNAGACGGDTSKAPAAAIDAAFEQLMKGKRGGGSRHGAQR